MRPVKIILTGTVHLPARILLISLVALLIVFLASRIQADETLQVIVSATPVQISLPSPLPFATDALIATEAATRTPTPIGPALLEALTEANVRAEADTNSDKLGTIRSGDVYPVIGRYYQWFKFQYNAAPGGVGWVFGDLVKIIGDESTITDLTQNALPTLDPISVGATGTMNIITQTPGGLLTATANAAVISLPVEPGSGGSASVPALPQDSSVLPTFTFPPDIPLQPASSTQEGVSEGTATEDTGGNPSLPQPSQIPPIAPILILGGLGIVGLFISSYRR